MDKTHFNNCFDKDYLAGSELDGKDLIVTIKTATQGMVKNKDGESHKIILTFVENCKPAVINITNAKSIRNLTGSKFIEDWVGHKIQFYSEYKKAFGELQDMLRIRPYKTKSTVQSEIPIKCADCSEIIKPFASMTATELAEYTTEKYKKALCSDCAAKAAKSQSGPLEEIKDVENNNEVEGEKENENNEDNN